MLNLLIWSFGRLVGISTEVDMRNENSISGIIRLSLPKYLAEFVANQLKSGDGKLKINRNTFVGSTLYRLLDKVPEDCHFVPPAVSKGKVSLIIDITTVGYRNEERKNYKHYYFPSSRQKDFEASMKDYFDELFFSVLSLSAEYSDVEYKMLINSFCEKYGLDFTEHYEALKKKYYRHRVSLQAD